MASGNRCKIMQYSFSMSELPQILSRLRSEKGLSYRRLSKAVGISHNNLACYENGSVVPSIDMAAKLSAFYDVPLEYLLRGDDYMKEFQDGELRQLLGAVDKMDRKDRELVKRFIKKVIRNYTERIQLEKDAE